MTAANAISAYETGATGRGIKIAVIDSGLDPTIAEFAGRVDPASADMFTERNLMADEWGHGSAVADVAAGAKNDLMIHGVAFRSTIVALRVDAPGTCAEGNCIYAYSAITRAIDAARLASAKVINMSIVGPEPPQEMIAAVGRALAAGILVVICAGNDAQANPGQFALTEATRYPGQLIIAGSIGVDNGAGGINLNQISTFSNRAGSVAPDYLTALGYNVNSIGFTGTVLHQWSGTSFAAPAISGAAALLFEAFPNLTAKEVIEILFGTADDLGQPGVDGIYGHGRLNIGQAFQPLGKTTVAGSSTPVSLVGNGDLPAAAGDAGDQSSGGMIILDGYSRAFALDFAKTLRRAERDLPLGRAIQGRLKSTGGALGPVGIAMTIRERSDGQQGATLELMGIGPADSHTARLIAGSAVARLDDDTAVALGFAEGAKAMERRLAGLDSGGFLIAKDGVGEAGFVSKLDGSLALRRRFGPIGVTVSAERGDIWQRIETRATGSPYLMTSVGVDRAFGRGRVSATISRLEEKHSLLGGRMSDALGGGGSSTLFLDLEARHGFTRGWNVALRGRRGRTDFVGGNFATAAYSIDIVKDRLVTGGDRLGLRLSQPLRVEHGGFEMMLPTSYDYSTQAPGYSPSRLSLVPSGREIDAEFSYGSSLADRAWIGANLFARRQPGHIADADTDFGAAMRFSLGF